MTTKTSKTAKVFPKVSDLHFGGLDSKPITLADGWDYERLESMSSDGNWNFWEAVTCDKCGSVVVTEGGSAGGKHCDAVSCECDDPDDKETGHGTRDNTCRADCDGYLPAAEGPMMNYWYPCVVDDNHEAARKLVDLPLIVVEVDGESGLALTGGGMDMSWYIAEAFMRLGMLPPAHFAGNLPAMSGYPRGPKDRWIIAGCKRSLTAQMGSLRDGMRRLKDLENPPRKTRR